jgi:cation:H+ antiporter
MIVQGLLGFLASAAVVVTAGIMLGKTADRIGTLSGLGRVWTGAVLLALATSLPELVTDISAVRMGTPNLATGDLFGSNLTNMLILALIGLLPASKRVIKRNASDAIVACLAILLNALVVASLIAHPHLTVAGLHPEAALLPVVYLFGMRILYLEGAANRAGRTRVSLRERFASARSLVKPLALPVAVFALGAIMIFFAAPVLVNSAETIAQVSGLGSAFIGTWLVGLTTAMPELVTSLTAAMMGAGELATGNLFGSCAFNMVIFFPMDLAYGKGSIFGALDPVHAVTGSLSIVLMAVGLAALSYRRDRRLALIEPGSVLMLACYASSIGVVFAYTR